jgi:hypothetical protein
MVWSSQSKSYKADCETPLRMSGENFENFCKNLFSKKKKIFFFPNMPTSVSVIWQLLQYWQGFTNLMNSLEPILKISLLKLKSVKLLIFGANVHP